VCRPNILLILVDDMGFGDLGCVNGGLSETPALDVLAGEGVCLSQHYSASPVCAPARASLMTGRYPHRVGAVDVIATGSYNRLALREATFGDTFKAAGYATGLVGKWHNGAADPRFHPNRRGFDEFAGFRNGGMNYWDWWYERNGNFQKTDGRYLTDVLTGEAVDFVRRHKHHPFFLHVCYNAPHTPLQAPEEDIAPFRESGQFHDDVATLYGMIRRLDACVGRLTEELRRRGLEENTVVLFTSDNGPQFVQSGVMKQIPYADADPDSSARGTLERFNAGLRGCKCLVYEGGIRVPLILRWPAGLDGGRQLDGMTHLCDWFPTLSAMANVATPADVPLDGVNILPMLRGESAGDYPERFWQWSRYEPVLRCNAAARDGNWKLVYPVFAEAMRSDPADHRLGQDMALCPEKYGEHVPASVHHPGPFPDPPAPQLYNLADDPEERHDLAPAQPDRVSRLSRDLETWFASVEADRQTIAERS